MRTTAIALLTASSPSDWTFLHLPIISFIINRQR